MALTVARLSKLPTGLFPALPLSKGKSAGNEVVVLGVAPTYIADIGEYPRPREMCRSDVTFPEDLKFSWKLSVKR